MDLTPGRSRHVQGGVRVVSHRFAKPRLMGHARRRGAVTKCPSVEELDLERGREQIPTEGSGLTEQVKALQRWKTQPSLQAAPPLCCLHACLAQKASRRGMGLAGALRRGDEPAKKQKLQCGAVCRELSKFLWDQNT